MKRIFIYYRKFKKRQVNRQMTSLTLKISAEEKEALAVYCKENDIPMSQLVRKLIRDFLKQENSQN